MAHVRQKGAFPAVGLVSAQGGFTQLLAQVFKREPLGGLASMPCIQAIGHSQQEQQLKQCQRHSLVTQAERRGRLPLKLTRQLGVGRQTQHLKAWSYRIKGVQQGGQVRLIPGRFGHGPFGLCHQSLQLGLECCVFGPQFQRADAATFAQQGNPAQKNIMPQCQGLIVWRSAAVDRGVECLPISHELPLGLKRESGNRVGLQTTAFRHELSLVEQKRQQGGIGHGQQRGADGQPGQEASIFAAGRHGQTIQCRGI